MISDTTTHDKQTGPLVLVHPHCTCPDCAASAYYHDPEGQWWCLKHSQQAIFVAIGYEYKYPSLLFTNLALSRFAGIEGREQWYAFAKACRMRPAALEAAIFEVLCQFKLGHREIAGIHALEHPVTLAAYPCACPFPLRCVNTVGAVNGVCGQCLGGDHSGHEGGV